MTLFVPSKDSSAELWHGARSGTEGAVDVFGADDVSFSKILQTRVRENSIADLFEICCRLVIFHC